MNTTANQPFHGAFRGKKVLVTGHTGFKGSWFCEWLLGLGANVTGYALKPETQPSLFEQLALSDRVEHVVGDVRDLASFRCVVAKAQPDFVFHLAAQPLVRLSYREPVETWQTNVMGTINVLEALREVSHPCVAVMVTTDKVYENREWLHGYREEDPLGGYDPYSSSKGAAEIAIASWRRSFLQSTTNNRQPTTLIASARAGNVIGGGDWAEDRIVPDCIRALGAGQAIAVRNRYATRPWQHVLEPLSGYLSLAAAMAAEDHQPTIDHQRQQPSLRSAFNFGPHLDSNRSVGELVTEILVNWPGQWVDQTDPEAPHEASLLNLATDKAHHLLGWRPRWNFETTIARTVEWYRGESNGVDAVELTRNQILDYETEGWG